MPRPTLVAKERGHKGHLHNDVVVWSARCDVILATQGDFDIGVVVSTTTCDCCWCSGRGDLLLTGCCWAIGAGITGACGADSAVNSCGSESGSSAGGAAT